MNSHEIKERKETERNNINNFDFRAVMTAGSDHEL